MKAFEMMQPYVDFLQRLWAYCAYCATHPMSEKTCRDFWTWAMIGCFAVVGLILFFILKTIIKEQLEFYKNKKHIAARAIVADEQTMAEAKWKGEEAQDVPLSQEELAARMREALNARGNVGEPKIAG